MPSTSVALCLPIPVLLSPPAPLCLPWIWKQACRPFPLSHYHIQKGREREEAQDWIKREGNPLPPLSGFFIGLPIVPSFTSHCCSLFCFSLCLSSISRVPTAPFEDEEEENRAAFYAWKEKRDSESGKKARGKQGWLEKAKTKSRKVVWSWIKRLFKTLVQASIFTRWRTQTPHITRQPPQLSCASVVLTGGTEPLSHRCLLSRRFRQWGRLKLSVERRRLCCVNWLLWPERRNQSVCEISQSSLNL